MNRIFSNQKGGTLLCYVPDGAEAPKVAGICALLKVKYKELGSSELDRHIGYLLTGEEISEESRRVLDPAPEAVQLRAHAQPFFLFCGFSAATFDAFLAQLRKQKLRAPLKAALTETNASWTLRELYDAIRAEHETMTGEVL